MEKLISLNNSGESLEKSLSLYSTALQGNELFYNNFEVDIYYGHNLPKKNKKMSAHGTVKFYDTYFKEFECCNKENLWERRDVVLNYVVDKGYLSNRLAEKISRNQKRFWKIIGNFPLEYIYPQHFLKLKNYISKLYPNVHFKPLYLEQNFMKIYSILPKNKYAYSIYSLEGDGNIGHYYFNIKGNQYFERNLYHIFKELARKPVLSGNSAILLAQIGHFGKANHCIVGYRNHNRYPRPNRNYALNQMNNKKILEPSNNLFGHYFCKENSKLSIEEQANIAIAKAYRDFLNNNIELLSFMK